MKDIPIKNTGDTYSSGEFNTFYQNSKTPIEDSGQTLSEGDLTQQSKAMAIYASTSNFYTDGGTAGSYILTPIDDLESPPVLKDGMSVKFSPANDNVLVLPVTSVTRSGSTATVTTTSPHNLITGGLVLIQGAVEIEYNGIFQITVTGASTFQYTLIGTPSTPATGTITTTAGESTVTVGALASTRITRENGSGLRPNDLQVGVDVILRYKDSANVFLLLFPFEIAEFYLDLGTGSPVGEQYILISTGGKKAPNDYFNGFFVSFRPLASNTIGNPVLNIGGLGDKTITKEDGISNIAINDIVTTQDANFRFDTANDVFILLNGVASAFTDFTTFYTDSGIADAYVLTAAGGLMSPTSYFEGMFVRFRPDNSNTGASTANVSSLGLKDIKLSDGTTNPPAGFISTETDTYLRFDTANDALVFSEGFQPATTTEKGASFLFKRITLTTGASILDIDFGAGNFIFANGSGSAQVSALTKESDAAWATGDNAGGMPAQVTKTGTFDTTGTTVDGTGSLFLSEFNVGDVLFKTTGGQARTIDTITSDILMTIKTAYTIDAVGNLVKKNGLSPLATYHCFALSNADGSTTDFGFDTDITAVNLLADTAVVAAGLTKSGRQGSRLSNVSGVFLSMFQIGKSSYYTTRLADINITSLIATESFRTLTTPFGLEVEVFLSVELDDNTGSIVLITSPSEVDIAPTTAFSTIVSLGNASSAKAEIEIITNTLSQIRDRADAVYTVNTYILTNKGWDDKQLQD